MFLRIIDNLLKQNKQLKEQLNLKENKNNSSHDLINKKQQKLTNLGFTNNQDLKFKLNE